MSLIGLTLDYCRLPSASFGLTTKTEGGHLIEQANWVLNTAALTLGQVIISSQLQIDVNSMGQKTDFQISFTTPSVIELGSFANLQISDFFLLSSTSCTVNTGTPLGITCQIISGTPSLIKLTFTQSIPASTDITVQGKNLQNPKLSKSISVPISVTSVAGCTFLTGTGTTSVSTLATSTSLEVTTANKFLNVYTDYRFKFTPAQPSWDNNDYLLVEVPYGLSAQISCSVLSSNIASMTCSLHNITAFKVVLNVNPALFAANKSLEFTILYVLNPPQAGTNTNFRVNLVAVGGVPAVPTVFEKSPAVSGISYENYITAGFFNASFTSNLRGYLDYVKYNLSVNTLLAENTSIVLILSSKFENLSQVTLISSSPSMQLSTSNSESGRIILKLSSVVLPEVPLLFTLKQNNPTAELISSSDLVVELWQGSSQNKITKDSPIKSPITFVCDPSCQDCGKIYNECTVCRVNYTMSGTTCLENSAKASGSIQVRKETSIPFICLGIAVIISIIMVVVGLICKRCLFWGNFLYAILRPVYTSGIIVFVFFSYKNDESYWVIIAGLCILGIHVLISTIGSVFTFKALSNASMGAQTTENKFINAFLENYRDKTAEKIKIPRTKIWLTKVLSPAVGFGVFRWFFSSKRNDRGYFWYFDTPSFTFMKSVLQRFNMLYIFFVHIALIIVVSVSLAQTIYLFKIETICISILDLLVYVIAYFELNPFNLKKGAIKQKGKEVFIKETGDYHQLGNPDQSLAPDHSRLHENSNIGDENHPGTPTRRRRDSQEDRIKLDHPLKSKSKRDGKDDLADPRDQKTPTKTMHDEDGENQIRNTEDIFEYATGKSLSSIPSGSDINLRRAITMRKVPQFNPNTDKTLEVSTSNYSTVKVIAPDEHIFTGQRVCLTTLPSNLKPIPYIANFSSNKEVKESSILEKMKPSNNKLDVIYEESEGDHEGRWNVRASEIQKGSKLPKSGTQQSKIQTKLGSRLLKTVVEVPGDQIGLINDSKLILKDKEGRTLNLKNKNENGQFIDNEGRVLDFAFESEEGLKNGIILDRRGQKHKIQDQDFKLLVEEGKLLNENGEVIEIFGQNPKEMENGLVKLDDDTIIKLEQQKDALLKKGIIIKDDGTCLNTKIPQDKNKLAKGLFLDKNSKPYRLIDQTTVALKANEVKGFGGNAIIEPRAPKKPNKAYFKTEEISEDDPFRQDLSSKHSSVMMMKGESNGLKTGIVDLKPKRPLKQRTVTNDDDLSEYLVFPNRDFSEKDGERRDKDNMTGEFSKGSASYQENLNLARDSTKQVTRPSPASKTGTEVPSLKYIPDSPYQPKVSNFINSSNVIKETPHETNQQAFENLEIQSADQGKGQELYRRESREAKRQGNNPSSSKDKDGKHIPGRSPKRTSTEKNKKRSNSP